MSTNDAYHSYECPVPSQGPGAQGGEDVKCYKLSRKRWSYNEVELVIQESGGYDRQIRVQQVIQSIEAKVRHPVDHMTVGACLKCLNIQLPALYTSNICSLTYT